MHCNMPQILSHLAWMIPPHSRRLSRQSLQDRILSDERSYVSVASERNVDALGVDAYHAADAMDLISRRLQQGKGNEVQANQGMRSGSRGCS